MSASSSDASSLGCLSVLGVRTFLTTFFGLAFGGVGGVVCTTRSSQPAAHSARTSDPMPNQWVSAPAFTFDLLDENEPVVKRLFILTTLPPAGGGTTMQ